MCVALPGMQWMRNGVPAVQSWGVTLGDSFTPSAACTEYTDFLQQISTTEVRAYTGCVG